MIIKSYILEKNISSLKNFEIILLYGENSGLKKDFKKIIKETNKAKNINFTQEEILGNENLFFREIENKSLFDEKKIIFIDNVSDKFLKIIEECVSKNLETKVVLFSENLTKNSKIRNFFERSKKYHCVACYPDSNITLQKIIFEKLKGFEGLNGENINAILNVSGNDRYKLNNELEKIEICFKSKKIEKKKLLEILNISTNEDINKLKDEALNGNKLIVNDLLSNTNLENEKCIYYLFIVNQRLNTIAQLLNLKKNMPIEIAIAEIKPPIFWADKENLIKQAKIWSIKKVNQTLKKIYELEILIKSNNSIEKKLFIKKLFLDICNEANVV